MKLRRLAIMDDAVADLEHARDFYNRYLPELGAYCFDSIVADIESLGFFAGIHSRQFGYYRLLAKRFPFAVYYQISSDDEMVRVMAVLDMRQDPRKNIARLSSR